MVGGCAGDGKVKGGIERSKGERSDMTEVKYPFKRVARSLPDKMLASSAA